MCICELLWSDKNSAFANCVHKYTLKTVIFYLLIFFILFFFIYKCSYIHLFYTAEKETITSVINYYLSIKFFSGSAAKNLYFSWRIFTILNILNCYLIWSTVEQNTKNNQKLKMYCDFRKKRKEKLYSCLCAFNSRGHATLFMTKGIVNPALPSGEQSQPCLSFLCRSAHTKDQIQLFMNPSASLFI